MEEKKKDIAARDRAAYSRVIGEKMWRLKILADHYDINTDDPQTPWGYQLSMQLCQDFFQGFEVQYEQKRGRPGKWNTFTYSKLLFKIEKIKQEERCSDRRAIRIYFKDLRKRLPKESEIKSLEKNLWNARNPKKILLSDFRNP